MTGAAPLLDKCCKSLEMVVCTDATSGVVRTEYRIDGESWRVGTSAFLRLATRHKRSSFLRGTHTVQYRSTDAAGNREAVKSCQVTLGS